VINEVKSRPTVDVPFRGNGSASAFLAAPEGTPGDLFFFVLLLDELFVPIAVDADECERFALPYA